MVEPHPIFTIKPESDGLRAYHIGKVVLILGTPKSPEEADKFQYTFWTDYDSIKGLKRVTQFITVLEAKRQEIYALSSLETMDALHTSQVQLIDNNLSCLDKISEDYKSHHPIGFRFLAGPMEIYVASVMCEAGYLPTKLKDGATKLKITAKAEFLRDDHVMTELSDLIVDLGVAGLKQGTRFSVENLLRDMQHTEIRTYKQ